MPLADAANSVLVLIDFQPSFTKTMPLVHRAEHRAKFLVEIATLLEIPIIYSEQNPARMSGTSTKLLPSLKSGGATRIEKMMFSCSGCSDFDSALKDAQRQQVIIAGVEAHICVCQTAIRLLDKGYQVFVCEDAIEARFPFAVANGLQRMSNAGSQIVLTESIAYEWMGSADHPKFRDALNLVKTYALELD